MAAVRRGAFILLEGVDRAGKSTQVRKLVDSIVSDGGKAVLRRFPDRETAIGKMINSYLTMSTELDDRAVHLLFAANRWEAVADMKQQLAAGQTLVVDRYSFSGVAFSGAKDGMSIDWCKKPEIGLPKPDLVIFLDLTVEEAEARGGFGEERYEKVEFQKRVRANFGSLMDDSWVVVDAKHSVDEVHAEIKALAQKAIDAAGDTPLGTLWSEEAEAEAKGSA